MVCCFLSLNFFSLLHSFSCSLGQLLCNLLFHFLVLRTTATGEKPENPGNVTAFLEWAKMSWNLQKMDGIGKSQGILQKFRSLT